MEEKKLYTPALILSLIGLVFSFISPLIAYICCIVSLVMAIKKRKKNKSKLIVIFDAIGLIIAIINNVIATIILSN